MGLMTNDARWADMNQQSIAFLQRYRDTLAPKMHVNLESRHIVADFFCADIENANLCATLVLNEEKRATCGLALLYDLGHDQAVEVGDLMIVQDWHRNPVCIVEFTHIRRLAFKQIDADFAFSEGEGDKSYAWWRSVHWDFFSKEMEALGREMTEDVEIVTEHFRLVWPV